MIRSTLARLRGPIFEARIRPVRTNTVGMEIEMAIHPDALQFDAGLDWPMEMHRLHPLSWGVLDALTQDGKVHEADLLDLKDAVSKSWHFMRTDQKYLRYIKALDDPAVNDDWEHAWKLLTDLDRRIDELLTLGYPRTAWIKPAPDATKEFLERLREARTFLGSVPEVFLGTSRHVDPDVLGDVVDLFGRAFKRIGWTTTTDDSIRPQGREAVSPVYSLNDTSGLEKGLDTARMLMKRGWVFNDTTGVHLHVGTDKSPDAFYLLSMAHAALKLEPWVYQHFPTRVGNRHAPSITAAWTKVMQFLWHFLQAEKAGADEGDVPASAELSESDVDHLLSLLLPPGESNVRYQGLNILPALEKHGTVEFRYFHGTPLVERPELIRELVHKIREMLRDAQTSTFIDAAGGRDYPRLIIERSRSHALRVSEPQAASPLRKRVQRVPFRGGSVDSHEVMGIMAQSPWRDLAQERRVFPSGSMTPTVYAAYMQARRAKERSGGAKLTQKANKKGRGSPL